MIYKKKFPNFIQVDSKDCGPTCLKIISKYYGIDHSLEKIREYAETTREGSSLLSLSEAGEKLGFNCYGAKVSFEMLKNVIPFPCIVHWRNNHFVVVYDIKDSGKGDESIYVSDPGYGLITCEKEKFIEGWCGTEENVDEAEGIVLVIEPADDFTLNRPENSEKQNKFRFLFKYLTRFKSLFFQLGLGIIISSFLSFLIPVLTQGVIDNGIINKDYGLIYLLFLGQFLIYIGKSCTEIIKSWVLLHISTRISISLISDFLIKLMKLPISFFDTRMTGDIMQRIADHDRVERFLTHSFLEIIFSMINFLIYGIVLLLYDYKIFLLYLTGSIVYTTWIFYFLKQRRKLDYESFAQSSSEQTKIMEIVNGMQEIKLFNAEKQKRWEWENLQVNLFKIKNKSLYLEQYQSVGGGIINQIKDLVITFYVVTLVIQGNLTLGMMFSVQFIIGQLSNPFFQLIDFVRQLQDTKISLERLSEIHEKPEEEQNHQIIQTTEGVNIKFSDVSFRYTGSQNFVFKNLNLEIPYRKTTAIVGISGSGKTTLLKMMMKYYTPTSGIITLGDDDLEVYSAASWRARCGTVMQEGYIFNDTIRRNIALGDDDIDEERLYKSAVTANIIDYINTLPLKFDTMIGDDGNGLSGGQKQRLFIARAVYKSPEFIFFDEATSSLDSNNERRIIDNLNEFFKNKTAVIIAHRLSTVMNADKIIVLDNGNVVEQGTHEELIASKGEYFRLVQNQLG